jgi:hypothetical protein
MHAARCDWSQTKARTQSHLELDYIPISKGSHKKGSQQPGTSAGPGGARKPWASGSQQTPEIAAVRKGAAAKRVRMLAGK